MSNKRTRLSANSAAAAAEPSASQSSGMRLRPRDATDSDSTPRRMSFRIVASGSGQPQPTIIRVTRPRSPEPAIEIPSPGRSPRTAAAAPSSPVSISSESSENTLSSNDSEDTPSEASADYGPGWDMGYPASVFIIEGGYDAPSDMDYEPMRPPFPDRPYQAPAPYRPYQPSMAPRPYQAPVAPRPVEPAAPPVPLLDKPAVIVLMKTHNGRVKCSVCAERIFQDSIRLDYRPSSRTGAVKHCHIDCSRSVTQLYFPTDTERMVAFEPATDFQEAEKEEILALLRERLRPQPPSERRGNSPYPWTGLYAVVPGGDARVRADQQRRMYERRLAWQAANRDYVPGLDDIPYMMNTAVRENRYLGVREQLFPTAFGHHHIHHAPARMGLRADILASLPRMTVQAMTEDGEDQNCVICLDAMQTGQKVVLLPCFHRYHEKCISSWLGGSRLCPIDKLDIEKLIQDGGDSQAVPHSIQ